jgi:outer membrane protein assembly factor BamB
MLRLRSSTLSCLLILLVVSACKEKLPSGGTTTVTLPNPQSVSVLTQHNDNARAGWNASETVLTTTNVDAQHFGKVFSLAVDDQIYAQPLVAGHLMIEGSVHNAVFVATVNNTIYAFDGDNGALFWKRNYTAPGMRPPRNVDMTGACGGSYQDFSGNIGIVGTPVIDSVTSTMYFVARSVANGTFVQHLHAVSLLTGNDVAGSPVAIRATYAGSGDGSSNNVLTFDPQKQNQRQALTLLNGAVFVSFSSHCDWGPYHGWILGYNGATLQQQVVYNDTPNGYAGGVWESGMGMAADAQGFLYNVSGNGTVGVPGDPTNLTNRAESALKLAVSGSTLRVASYFTPFDYQHMNDDDLDYGGMGAMLIPNSRYFLTGDKAGFLYLLSTEAMGGYSPATNQVQQSFRLSANSEMHAQPAYFHGSAREFVYLWPENEPLRAIPFDRGTNTLDMTQATSAPASGPTGHSGAVLSVSSNGDKDGTGIVWASYAASGDAEHDVSPGVLRAFNANDVTKELWSNQRNGSRDQAGAYAKFASPTIANGHVYLPTFSNQVVVYGLLP